MITEVMLKNFMISSYIHSYAALLNFSCDSLDVPAESEGTDVVGRIQSTGLRLSW